MSSLSALSPALEETYGCLSRAPSFLCSQLKLTAADASPVENSFTGTDTRPNDRVADPMGRALIAPQCARRGLLISLLPHGRKGEGPSRSVKYLPRKAVSRPHAVARVACAARHPLPRRPVPD